MKNKKAQIILEYGILIVVVAMAMAVFAVLLKFAVKDKVNTLEAETSIEQYEVR